MKIIKVAALVGQELTAKIPHNYRILIIDDDEACALMMMCTLEDLGQKAKAAHDGQRPNCQKKLVVDVVYSKLSSQYSLFYRENIGNFFIFGHKNA